MFTDDVKRNQINSEQQIYTLTFKLIQMLHKKKNMDTMASHIQIWALITVERSRVKKWNIPNHLILIDYRLTSTNTFSDSKDRKTQSSRKCRRLTNSLKKQLLKME